MKTCIGCGKDFEKLSSFGLCKKCYNKKWKAENRQHCIDYMENYHENNKQEEKYYRKKYEEDNPEKVLEKQAYNRKYKKDHEEELKVQSDVYYENNKENLRQSSAERMRKKPISEKRIYNRTYRLKNKERLNKNSRERNSERMKTDPIYAFRTNMRKFIGNSIKRGGYVKDSKTEQLVGCSFEDLSKHLGPKPKGKYDLDHICPITQGKTKEEIIKLQNYNNLRWTNSSLNRTKQDNKTPEGEALCKSLLGREWTDKVNT